jgi:ribose transport system substrate-binding protein
MMTTFKSLTALVASAIGLLAAVGVADDVKPTQRLVILTIGPDPFWDACMEGAQAAHAELSLEEIGYEIDFRHGDFTSSRQLEEVRQYAADGDVAALAISVFNSRDDQLAAALTNLQVSGVPVITIDGDIDADEFPAARFGYIGSNQTVMGRELGRAARALNPEANYAFFVGSLGARNAVERMDGFVDGIGEEAAELDRLEDGGDRRRCYANIGEALDRHATLDMFVGIWAYNTPFIADLVDQEKIRDRVHVIGLDAAADSLDAMEDGNVDALVVQNPYLLGYESARVMLALAEDDQAVVNEVFAENTCEARRDRYLLPPRVVVPDEASPITADLFDESTEFFRLSEFRDWLEGRGLTSS